MPRTLVWDCYSVSSGGALFVRGRDVKSGEWGPVASVSRIHGREYAKRAETWPRHVAHDLSTQEPTERPWSRAYEQAVRREARREWGE